MADNSDLCLRVKDLTKTYILSNQTSVTALDKVSFSLRKGEILGIIGRSGGGKTSLIRILRGVEPFDNGEFELDGLRITPDASAKTIRDLKSITAIHLQRSFALWADTVLVNVMRRINALETGDETIDLPEEIFSDYIEMKEQALDLLKAVNLQDKADHTADTLSGGEKQRLQLARQLAIAKNLKLLLLDEPLTMAGPDTKLQGLELIKKIRQQFQFSIIVASHYPKLLLSFVDRLIWLDDGIIKAEGSPQEVIKKFLATQEDLIPFKKERSTKAIIQVNGLSRVYYTPELNLTFRLEKVTFDVKVGEVLGIIGPSGEGKSVLCQLLAGVDLPKEGEVLYFLGEEKGVNICLLGIDSVIARQQIAYVRQELDLTYNAMIKDLAAGVLGIKGEPAIAAAKKRAKELGIKEQIVDFIHRLGDLSDSEVREKLEKLGLEPQIIHDLFPIPPWSAIKDIVVPIFEQMGLKKEILERRSQEISGGEKVRIALALALLSGPKVLILDEIGGDIDPLTLRGIRNLLIGINNQFNTTIICASHNISFIEELSHRILYLKAGDIIKIGDPKEMLNLFLNDSKGI